MRVLTKDDKRADEIVRDMEARGFELTSVDNASTNFDMTALEYLAFRRKQKRSRRWAIVWQLIGWSLLISLIVLIT